MRIQGRIFVITLAAAAFVLSGCALDPTSNFDNGTLFKGKQAWEAKRHADDWLVPLGDGAAVFGISMLAYVAQCVSIDALTRAFGPHDSDRGHEPAYVAPCNNP
jgi:hypothetical protein